MWRRGERLLPQQKQCTEKHLFLIITIKADKTGSKSLIFLALGLNTAAFEDHSQTPEDHLWERDGDYSDIQLEGCLHVCSSLQVSVAVPLPTAPIPGRREQTMHRADVYGHLDVRVPM